MKYITKNGLKDFWEMGYSHLQNSIMFLQSHVNEYIRENMGFRSKYTYRYSISFKKAVDRHVKENKLRLKFLIRELNFRDKYPEYKTFCEKLALGMSSDTSFLSAFSDWCQDHGMMVQARKIQRKIDSIKGLINVG